MLNINKGPEIKHISDPNNYSNFYRLFKYVYEESTDVKQPIGNINVNFICQNADIFMSIYDKAHKHPDSGYHSLSNKIYDLIFNRYNSIVVPTALLNCLYKNHFICGMIIFNNDITGIRNVSKINLIISTRLTSIVMFMVKKMQMTELIKYRGKHLLVIDGIDHSNFRSLNPMTRNFE